MEKYIIIITALIILTAILCLIEAKRELGYFKITHDEVRSKKLKEFLLKDSSKDPSKEEPLKEALSKETPELRIIFLSDLHNKEYGKNNADLLEAIRQEQPDLILIGGDMLIGKPEGKTGSTSKQQKDIYHAALRFVGKLPEICPVYYANGNHEQRMKEDQEEYGNVYERYSKALRNAGVHFLENESIVLRVRGQDIRITGLELPEEIYRKFRKITVEKRNIEKCVGKAADGSGIFQILLAHNPAYFPAYKEWGADLVLSGHLHGGIIRLPFLGGLISPQAVPFPKYSGEMTREGEHTIIVSRGLGTHTVNLRFLNEAEVIVIHLKAGSI